MNNPFLECGWTDLNSPLETLNFNRSWKIPPNYIQLLRKNVPKILNISQSKSKRTLSIDNWKLFLDFGQFRQPKTFLYFDPWKYKF